MSKNRYVLLKDDIKTDIEFSTKMEAALWQSEKTAIGLDWSVGFMFKLKGDSATYRIVDIKTNQEPKNFDWRKI